MSEAVNFEPVSDFLLIEPLLRNQTLGGIALPEGADPDPPKGRVVKAGPGRETELGATIEMPVKVGDVVYMYFAYQKPVELKLAGKVYAVVRARDLIGTVPDPSSTSDQAEPGNAS